MNQILRQKKLIILDRDGVINQESPGYVKSPEEWQAIPSSLQAIAALTQAGIRVAVATNQSGVARGFFDVETLAAIHDKMQAEAIAVGGKIDKIVFCPHHPSEGCDCRKPKTGLLQQISTYFGIDLKGVPFIGDTHKDVGAALAMQCQPILVTTGYGDKSLPFLPSSEQVLVYKNLKAAVDALLDEDD